MIVDEDIYLEHYGVLGMKWGVRKSISERREANRKKYGGKDKKTRTAAQKRARMVRNFKRTNRAIIATSGALFILGVISSQKGGSRPRPNLNDYKTPSDSVKDVIDRNRKVKIDAIEKTFKEGFIDEDQFKKFTESINKRYDRKIVDALKDVG